MKYLLIISMLMSFSAYADNKCEAVQWNSERSSNNTVSVWGAVNTPNTIVDIEVWKYRTLIGTGWTVSNARGVFRKTIYTNKRPSKQSGIVISCQK